MTTRRPDFGQRGRRGLPGGDAHDPRAALREEAERIARRLEELVATRRAETHLPARNTPPVPSAPATTRPISPEQVVGARHSGRLLGNLLVDRGFATSDQIQHALAKQHNSGLPLGQIVVELGMLDEHALVELLAEQLRMDTINLRRTTIDGAIGALLPERHARRLCALPVSRTGPRIDIAIADPTNNAVVHELIERLGSPVRLLLATRTDIEATIDYFHGTTGARP